MLFCESAASKVSPPTNVFLFFPETPVVVQAEAPFKQGDTRNYVSRSIDDSLDCALTAGCVLWGAGGGPRLSDGV